MHKHNKYQNMVRKKKGKNNNITYNYEDMTEHTQGQRKQSNVQSRHARHEFAEPVGYP